MSDEETKGKIREQKGKITGDKSEQIKGKAEQVKGKVQEEVGKTKRKGANQEDYLMFCSNFDLKEIIDIKPVGGSVYIKSVCEPFDAEMGDGLGADNELDKPFWHKR